MFQPNSARGPWPETTKSRFHGPIRPRVLGRAAESEAGAPGQLMDTGPLLDTCTEHNFQNLKIVVDLFVGC